MRAFVYENRKLLYFLSVVAFLGIFSLVAHERLLMMNFNGIVENIYYDVKGRANVTINGQEYTLDNARWQSPTITIEQGDKLIKKKGEMDLKLIKRNTFDTIYFLNKPSR